MLTILNYVKRILKQNKGFLILMLCFFSIRWSYADHYRVPTGSMLPTIQIGDDVLVDKMAFDLKIPFTDIIVTKLKEPKRGEIVVFKYPKDPSLNFVKRLIGVPGDEIEIINGYVMVNGEKTVKFENDFLSINSHQEILGEKEFTVERIPSHMRGEHLKLVVPKDKYFFMGDNRDNSLDSRFWGFVDRAALKGRVTHVTFSVSFEEWIPNIKWGRFGRKLI